MCLYPKLIKLVTASKGAETKSDDEDQTPDVVYNENGIVIWNALKKIIVLLMVVVKNGV